MAERPDSESEYKFRVVQLFKNDTLGSGSYGTVCKAKCDQLLCAAKMLFPVLFQSQEIDEDREYRRPIRRFERECQFLSCINHPNIVQYLGTYRDPETNGLVLLMELMDESLTHFLESSPGDLYYHIQVNLSYNIAQALAFLHSNGIIHRDLSSNNVLLLASTRAKVTDFGMSKFIDLNVRQRVSMTLCPGTPDFMSPEALNEPTVYTEKLDNFSFGVLLVQIMTRQFPKPTDRSEMRELFDRSHPNQAIKANVPVPELERRQAHIDLIRPEHPLLQTALHCLKDNDGERPTATQLCQTLTALKRTAEYQESSQQDLHQVPSQQGTQLPYSKLQTNEDKLKQKNAKLLADQEKLSLENTKLQKIIAKKNEELQQKKELLLAKENTIERNQTQMLNNIKESGHITAQFEQATQDNHTLQRQLNAREDQLKMLRYELQSSEENCAALQQAIQQRDREVSELRQELASKNEQVVTTRLHHVALQDKIQAPSKRPVTMWRWQSLPDIPADMVYGSSAVIEDKTYFTSLKGDAVYEFSNDHWHKLPSACINSNYTIVSVENLLTTVGGKPLSTSNKLYSYINNQWVERFPSMPTKRWNPEAIYINNMLVVIGGYYGKLLTTIEILNTVNRQWSSVSSLPFPMRAPSTTICRDNVYIHPRNIDQEKNSVYKCSLKQLVQSRPSSVVWEKITSLPVSFTSLSTVNGLVFAVGGLEENQDQTINIHQYDNASWTVVGHMASPRSVPLTAVLPGNKLMVVGGEGEPRTCELATIA